MCGRLERNPAPAEKLCRRIVVRIDVDELDPQLLRPQAPLRAFKSRVPAVRTLRVARPEHDQLRFLQAVLDNPVGCGDADALAVAPMMQRAPIPTLPAVGIGG